MKKIVPRAGNAKLNFETLTERSLGKFRPHCHWQVRVIFESNFLRRRTERLRFPVEYLFEYGRHTDLTETLNTGSIHSVRMN